MLGERQQDRQVLPAARRASRSEGGDMKISEMIDNLQAIQRIEGDIEVTTYDECADIYHRVVTLGPIEVKTWEGVYVFSEEFGSQKVVVI